MRPKAESDEVLDLDQRLLKLTIDQGFYKFMPS